MPKGHCWFLGGEVDGTEAAMRAVEERAERGCAVVKVMVSGGNITPGNSPFDPQFRNPWGFNPVEANVRMLQAGPSAMRPRMRNGKPVPVDGSIEEYMDAGLMFVGTPDEVYEQLVRFNAETGGFGNLLMMGQAGELDHADTVDNLTLVAREVAPRLAELAEIPLDVRYEAVG